MKCINNECEKKQYCEKIHMLNDCELGKSDLILIPNQFYFELNFGNRLVKRGIPSNGFKFGCMKLSESENGDISFYINNEYITDLNYNELLDCCNNSFSEMIASGEIKIG
ncbi:Uncharacterised protein [[Clostridium] sordellii]|uniref:hypothetical protein n=1 Tax=Paraclostridium sordellii TaxID=1505 RepID=UPI0005E88C59|nr:hypothetical protein [Paeniclostridium sordellii]CEQ00433.1 Uncharacterised protein [[Clostridium] sordellii] [Paeniclostridium sordellii]